MYIELFSHKSIVFIIILEIDWFNSLICLFINENKQIIKKKKKKKPNSNGFQ